MFRFVTNAYLTPNSADLHNHYTFAYTQTIHAYDFAFLLSLTTSTNNVS